jgi:hypothetical protein
MAFGSIWVFMRMSPAIETIIQQSERSLCACEEMLSSLALVNTEKRNHTLLKEEFSKALHRAKRNITEKEEPIAIADISKNYSKAFDGSSVALKKTISAIRSLCKINRKGMVSADQRAQQIGKAGAWGIVFMASAVFWVGILFIRSLRKNVVKPLEEVHSVIKASKSGDSMRRCTGPDMPRDIRVIFSGINDLLDKKTSSFIENKGFEKYSD